MGALRDDNAGTKLLPAVPLVTSCILAAVSLCMLHLFVTNTDIISGKQPFSSPRGYNAGNVISFLAWLLLAPASLIALAIGLLNALKSSKGQFDFESQDQAQRLPYSVHALFLCTFVGAVAVSIGVGFFVFSAGALWRCGYLLCWNVENEPVSGGGPPPEGFHAVMGSLIFLMGLVVAWTSLQMWSRVRWTCRASPSMSRRISAFCLLLAIPFWMLSCGILPNSYEGFTPDGMHKAATQKMGAGISEIESPFMETANVKMGSVYLKFFPDLWIFYGFLELLVLGGFLCSEFPALSRMVTRRVAWNWTLGQLMQTLFLIAFYVLFTLYWGCNHAYEGGKWNHPWTERWSRTMSMNASATLGLLLLPASRNSPMLKAAGLSWESSLYMHIGLGFLFLLLALGHVLLMLVNLINNPVQHWTDILPFNFGWVWYKMNPPWDQPGDDWTIAMMTSVFWPAVVIYGILPFLRRKFWEVFKVAHYFFLALVPAVLIHGTNSWYFIVPGASLWVLDAVLKLANAAEPVEIVHAVAHETKDGERISELHFKWFGCSRQHSPGMFCWINCPQLSTIEWHPFSLASSPSDESQSLFVKSMEEPGKMQESFTGRLHKLIGSLGNPRAELVLNIDGPYGPNQQLEPAVLLIAGGIGITPMRNMLRFILHNSTCDDSLVKRVHLVWVVKSSTVFDIFAPSLLPQVATDSLACELKLSLHCTSGEAKSCALGPIREGRPNISEIFKEQAAHGDRVMARACGPSAMIASCDAALASMAKSERDRMFYEPWSFVL